MDFLKHLFFDLLGLYRELAKSSLAFALVAVVALDSWRKRMTPGKLIGAVAVAYIASIYYPANGLLLVSQKEWYNNALRDWSDMPVWVAHVQSWHLDTAFLSNRAITLALTFYSIILIGSATWYKMVGRLVGLWLLLVGLALGSVFLMIKFELPMMLPQQVEITSTNFPAIDAGMRKSLEWYFNLPVVCAANAMCAILFSVMIYEIVKKQRGITRSRLLFHVVCPILVFTAALVSLEVLPFTKALLWLLFMIALYAPILNAIRTNLAGDRGLLDLYVQGARSLISWQRTETT